MTDIVTRLRQALETNESILLTMPRPTVQMMADEIERLREQNEYLKANVEMLLAEARAVRGE